jgi:acetyltransferase-like isoleucine patch superfamily enzyme
MAQVGAGAIVGAGAVVTKPVPARSVAVGVPAAVIKTLGG